MFDQLFKLRRKRSKQYILFNLRLVRILPLRRWVLLKVQRAGLNLRGEQAWRSQNARLSVNWTLRSTITVHASRWESCPQTTSTSPIKVQRAGFEPANHWGLGPHPSAVDQAWQPLLQTNGLTTRISTTRQIISFDKVNLTASQFTLRVILRWIVKFVLEFCAPSRGLGHLLPDNQRALPTLQPHALAAVKYLSKTPWEKGCELEW